MRNLVIVVIRVVIIVVVIVSGVMIGDDEGVVGVFSATGSAEDQLTGEQATSDGDGDGVDFGADLTGGVAERCGAG